jgi:putative acetyltransferase
VTTIRAETDAEHDAIRQLIDEAFGDTVTSKIVDGIRDTDRFVPELSLVAVSGGQTVGHVISSYVDVVPGRRRVLQVGPLAVVPSHQRQGIGSALMEETIRIADARGEPLLLIEGNPKYYGRFGFTRADEHGIEMPPESHGAQYFMIRPLAAYDPELRGRAIYPAETFGLGY